MAHLHSMYDSDTHFSINPVTRIIKNESNTKTKIMQGDHNSERFTFNIQRNIEGHDMSACDRVEIQYININSASKQESKDVYVVNDVGLSPDDDNVVIFSWLISGSATKYEGSLNFLIRFICLNGDTIEYAWNTAISNEITIGKGMDNGEAVIARYSDVLEAWKNEILSGIGLPKVTAADNGKVLQVKDGAWSAENLSGLQLIGSVNVVPSKHPDEYGNEIFYYLGEDMSQYPNGEYVNYGNSLRELIYDADMLMIQVHRNYGEEKPIFIGGVGKSYGAGSGGQIAGVNIYGGYFLAEEVANAIFGEYITAQEVDFYAYKLPRN